MKRFLITLFFILFLSLPAFSQENIEVQAYSDDGINWGLEIKGGEKISKPIYKKLIRLGNNAWIAQKRTKYGIVSNDGEVLVKTKYRHAERYFGKYAKLGNDNDFGVYDEFGNVIVRPEYSRIELLYGKMFLTCKKYKYGVVSFEGKPLLANNFEDIYMPTFKTIRIKYKGEWYEIEKAHGDVIELPENVVKVKVEDEEYLVTHLFANTGVISEYSVVTITDFILKMMSSISPAYEATIDDLMLSHGIDTISIFASMSWLPQFPVTYAKKYYQQLANPHTGPLSDMRERILQDLK